MADAVLGLSSPAAGAAQVAACEAVDPPPALVLGADRLCAAIGLLSLSWVATSVWPGLSAPAWPAASLGLLALSLAWLPGRVRPKAVGTLCGFTGLCLGAAQILALWTLLAALP